MTVLRLQSVNEKGFVQQQHIAANKLLASKKYSLCIYEGNVYTATTKLGDSLMFSLRKTTGCDKYNLSIHDNLQ